MGVINLMLTFGTTARHNELLSSFFANVFDERKNNQLRAFQEQCPLVYLGERSNLGQVKLIDADTYYNKCDELYDYEYVQPDFMMFKNNKYIVNKKGTRFLGIPDLVIEIWSERNDDIETHFKKLLYSTGQEHWYLTQHSNKVECWIGTEKLQDQYLTEILKTQQNVEFDLRFLSI